MKKNDVKHALDGHPNAAEIMAVLESPTEPHEAYERKAGWVVGSGEIIPTQDTGDHIDTAHRLPHWNCGFDATLYIRHNSRQKKKRARHGLQFLERPHRKGRFVRVNLPNVRKKIKSQYFAQVQAEANGEQWNP